jgi:hypothetical protein
MFDSTRHSSPWWRFAMLLGAALASGTAFAQTRAYLDPLTDAERRVAEGVASEDARVRKPTGDCRMRLALPASAVRARTGVHRPAHHRHRAEDCQGHTSG